jgi:hypothetical protein
MGGSIASRRILHWMLAIVTIRISLDAMACVARFKNRAENARIAFLDTKLLEIMQGVYTAMSRQAQDAISAQENPFALDLENRIRRFFQFASNSGGIDDARLATLIQVCHRLRQDIDHADSILQVQSQLTSETIYGGRHETSLSQTAVLDLYDWCTIRWRHLEEQQCLSQHYQEILVTAPMRNFFIRDFGT